jgi:hypothetical protein
MNSGAIPTWLWMFIVGRCSLAPPVVDIRLFFLRGIISPKPVPITVDLSE